MRSFRRAACAVVALLLTMVTTACAPSQKAGAPSQELAPITLAEARTYQNEVLLELMSFVPADVVTGGMTAPIDRMHAMTCDWLDRPNEHISELPDTIFLPGGYDLEVTTRTNLDALFDEVQAVYGGKHGWAVSSSGDQGERVLELVSPAGYTFTLESYPLTATTLRVSASSFSPCLGTPEGFDPFEKY